MTALLCTCAHASPTRQEATLGRAAAFEQHRLDIPAREAELLRLVERVKRPTNGRGICRHEPAG
jgi:hypothetical protein